VSNEEKERNKMKEVTSTASTPLIQSPDSLILDNIIGESIIGDVQTHEVGDCEDLEGRHGATGVRFVVVAAKRSLSLNRFKS
jgi:hypothetical protein